MNKALQRIFVPKKEEVVRRTGLIESLGKKNCTLNILSCKLQVKAELMRYLCTVSDDNRRTW
jgi:hypothetical protein